MKYLFVAIPVSLFLVIFGTQPTAYKAKIKRKLMRSAMKQAYPKDASTLASKAVVLEYSICVLICFSNSATFLIHHTY